MSRYALLKDGVCVNVVRWDGNTSTWDPAPLTAVLYDPAVHVVAEPAEAGTRRTMEDRLRQGLNDNQAFRALPTPTAAQQTAYLRSVARQLSALERLALGNLDSTAD